MKLSISTQSHTGLVRANNEDMILIGTRRVRDEVYEIELSLQPDTPLLIALADGMGGHNAGEVASEEVLKSLAEFFSQLPTDLSPEALKSSFTQWVQTAHSHLQQIGSVNPACAGMGTTLVGLIIYGNQAWWLNCGDSRIYRFAQNELEQLSTDHSYEQATGRKDRPNVITNCVGCGNHVYIDMALIPDFLSPEDSTFLLCSDGLSDLVTDEQIGRLLRAGLTAPALVRAALAAGGRDNVSAVTVRLKR